VIEVFDWSAVVFVRGLDGVIAVRKRRKDGTWGPWTLAGGKREPFELSATETAQREFWEETGIRLPVSAFRVVDQIPRVTLKHRKGQRKKQKHYYELFYCIVELRTLNKSELRSLDRREEVRFFPFAEYRRMKNFLGLHRRFIQKHRLVPSPTQST